MRAAGTRTDISRKSPAQILFERIIKTWVLPAVERGIAEGSMVSPTVLKMALIIWRSPVAPPEVLINKSVGQYVSGFKFRSTQSIEAGEAITPEKIAGLERVQFHQGYHAFPYVFLCEGYQGRYFVRFGRLEGLHFARRFKAVEAVLAKEGVLLTSGHSQIPVFLDLTMNGYGGSPTQKRRFTLSQQRTIVDEAKTSSLRRVKRLLKLPPLMVHLDDDVLALLHEARNTYVDGRFFSCVAASATAADRICLHLATRYSLTRQERNSLLNMTFGQKPQKLLKLHLIDESDETVLRELNAIRNKYIHPRQSTTNVAAARDSLRAVLLLHEFVEKTVSVFHDYVIEKGILVPRPL